MGDSLKRLAIFCGAAGGNDPLFTESARAVGKLLATRGIAIIYGGGSRGMMGALAEGALYHGGEVHGVIPEIFRGSPVVRSDLTSITVTPTMQERKTLMIEKSDGFISLPGGIGTFDELFEAWTLAKLRFHGKPSALLNVKNFYGPLLKFLEQVVAQGYLEKEHLESLIVDEDCGAILDRMRHYAAPALPSPSI